MPISTSLQDCNETVAEVQITEMKANCQTGNKISFNVFTNTKR